MPSRNLAYSFMPLIAAAGMNTAAQADILAYEGFDYPAGFNNSMEGGTGLSTPWLNHIVPYTIPAHITGSSVNHPLVISSSGNSAGDYQNTGNIGFYYSRNFAAPIGVTGGISEIWISYTTQLDGRENAGSLLLLQNDLVNLSPGISISYGSISNNNQYSLFQETHIVRSDFYDGDDPPTFYEIPGSGPIFTLIRFSTSEYGPARQDVEIWSYTNDINNPVSYLLYQYVRPIYKMHVATDYALFDEFRIGTRIEDVKKNIPSSTTALSLALSGIIAHRRRR